MAGVMPHTDKALNPVAADQTVEAELATLVSEYLQYHRCTQAYEVREERALGGASSRRPRMSRHHALIVRRVVARLSRLPRLATGAARCGNIVAAAC